MSNTGNVKYPQCRIIHNTTYEQIKTGIMNAKGTSDWIKNAVDNLEGRDIWEVLCDLSLLKKMFDIKFEEILDQESGRMIGTEGS